MYGVDLLSSFRVDRSEIPSPPSTKLRQAISKLLAFGSADVDLTPVTGSFLQTEQYLRFGIVKPSNDHSSAIVVVIRYKMALGHFCQGQRSKVEFKGRSLAHRLRGNPGEF